MHACVDGWIDGCMHACMHVCVRSTCLYVGTNGTDDIVELRTPAMPVGVGGGKERGGFHLNLRT